MRKKPLTIDKIQDSRKPTAKHNRDTTDISINSAHGQMAYKKKKELKYTKHYMTRNFVFLNQKAKENHNFCNQSNRQVFMQG